MGRTYRVVLTYPGRVRIVATVFVPFNSPQWILTSLTRDPPVPALPTVPTNPTRPDPTVPTNPTTPTTPTGPVSFSHLCKHVKLRVQIPTSGGDYVFYVFHYTNRKI